MHARFVNRVDPVREMDGSQRKGKVLWLYLAAGLGAAMILAVSLDYLAQAVPLGFSMPLFDGTVTLASILCGAIILVVGAYVGYSGLKDLIVEKRFSVEFLMSIAAIGAAYLGLYFEGATVLLLYTLAEYFEDYIEDRARRTIEKLSAFMPEKARIIENKTEVLVDVNDVKPNAIILVKPGERLPLDGVVVDGSANVEQALVTGESVPVLKRKNDMVYAGTLNMDGVLHIKVTRRSEETLFSKIVMLVTQSRERKANVERMVSRFARVYVPIVILIAALTAFVPPIFLGEATEKWLYRSLVLLVISCPSAFIISVPATIFTAITVAATRGIIVKGGAYIERMAKVSAVLFDKTGTLTTGSPKLLLECPYAHPLDAQTLTYIAALGEYSSHPVAKAIVEKAQENGLDFRSLNVKNVKEIAGRGLIGDVNGVRVGVGRLEMMGDSPKVYEDLDPSMNNGNAIIDRHSKVCAIVGNSLVTNLCLADQIRKDARETVRALKEDGIHTVMLTGDKREIAEDVAEKLGVDEFYADLFPEDKLKVLSQIRSKHGLVAMVGDGVNDAPALAASDVGIAMGESGIDVALESADIVLVKNELTGVPYLHRLSSLAVKIAKENIAVSLGVKLLLGVLGFVGLIPLWFAVAAGDDGVTMLLLLNTVRLARAKSSES